MSGDLSSVRDENHAELTAKIMHIIFTAEKPGEARKEVEMLTNDLVHTEGWYQGLAKRMLHHLEAALKSGAAQGKMMKGAFEKAQNTADELVEKHPVFAAVIVTVVAIGILALLLPWVVEALGFSELGPVEGTFAAWWQSTFPDAEDGSFFSYLQRLGMKWVKR